MQEKLLEKTQLEFLKVGHKNFLEEVHEEFLENLWIKSADLE